MSTGQAFVCVHMHSVVTCVARSLPQRCCVHAPMQGAVECMHSTALSKCVHANTLARRNELRTWSISSEPQAHTLTDIRAVTNLRPTVSCYGRYWFEGRGLRGGDGSKSWNDEGYRRRRKGEVKEVGVCEGRLAAAGRFYSILLVVAEWGVPIDFTSTASTCGWGGRGEVADDCWMGVRVK